MDVAGTFFARLTTILLALQDKSVSFHFSNNLDLDELDFLNSLGSFTATAVSNWQQNQNTWSRWASEVAYFLNSPKRMIQMNFFQRNFEVFCDVLLLISQSSFQNDLILSYFYFLTAWINSSAPLWFETSWNIHT